MFVRERSLLIGVTLDASRISTCRQTCLFDFEPSVRVMAVATAHGAFQYLVMEGLIELVLRLAVALHAELRLAIHQHFFYGEPWLLSIWRRHKRD
jgi:hypothetical protein